LHLRILHLGRGKWRGQDNFLACLQTAYNVNHTVIVQPNLDLSRLGLTVLGNIYGRLLAYADYRLDRNIDYVRVLIDNYTCTAAHPRTQPVAFSIEMNLGRINLQIRIQPDHLSVR